MILEHLFDGERPVPAAVGLALRALTPDEALDLRGETGELQVREHAVDAIDALVDIRQNRDPPREVGQMRGADEVGETVRLPPTSGPGRPGVRVCVRKPTGAIRFLKSGSLTKVGLALHHHALEPARRELPVHAENPGGRVKGHEAGFRRMAMWSAVMSEKPKRTLGFFAITSKFRYGQQSRGPAAAHRRFPWTDLSANRALMSEARSSSLPARYPYRSSACAPRLHVESQRLQVVDRDLQVHPLKRSGRWMDQAKRVAGLQPRGLTEYPGWAEALDAVEERAARAAAPVQARKSRRSFIGLLSYLQDRIIASPVSGDGHRGHHAVSVEGSKPPAGNRAPLPLP